MDVRLAKEIEGYLLLDWAGRFTVVERRCGRLYNLHGGGRKAAALDFHDLAEIIDECDWVEEAAACAALEAIVEQRARLAERMR